MTFKPQNTQNGCSISLARTNLTTTSATGSPANLAGNPAFSYSSAGSGNVASYTTTNANANPNTATIGGLTNSGGRIPGALATLKATYSCAGATASASFRAATFGLSCYYLVLESDWGSPPNNCKILAVPAWNETYSGASTNPSGMPAGTYYNAFLGSLRLQGSGSTNTGTKIRWASGDYPTWTFQVIKQFTGSGGVLTPNGSVARDTNIIPANGTTVTLPMGNYSATDTGGLIKGYRLDIFMGTGAAVCSGFQNNVVVGACSPATGTCPGQAVQ